MARTTSTTRREFLTRSAAATAAWTIPCCLRDGGPVAWAADEPLDLLISGGVLVDGSGGRRAAGDVGVRAGKIVAMGKLGDRTAKRRLDAGGLIVSPGFIDMHTHSDRTLLRDGEAHSAVRQGATTHVTGNCGSSQAPLNEASESGKNKFRTYGEYLDALRDSGISINVCGLVGHNRIRATAMGYDNRRPSESELSKMKQHVHEAMRAGAVGMSTGLVSPPGTYSETGEIVELARVVAEHRGLYASHIRGEAGNLIDAVNEAISIGRQAKLPVEISHHKAAGKENWGKTRITLLAIEAANKKGQTVRVDVYPYRAGSAGLSQLVPPWAHEGGRDAMLKRLADAKQRAKIVRDMTYGTPKWANFFKIDWRDIQITRVSSKANQKWVGRRVAELAAARGCSGIDACLDLLIEEKGNAGMVNFIMDENEMRRVLQHPLSMIGSDGTAVSREWSEGKPHPRYYGCFPRVLGLYVRQEKLLSLEAAIHKMTDMPARQLGLPDRGLLKIGNAADVVLFSEKKIIDRATFDDPHQYPEGIDSVIVNGRLVVHRGKHLGVRPGKILPPQRKA